MVTFHPIHHPVMDMGSRSLTAEGGWRWLRVQMGLSTGVLVVVMSTDTQYLNVFSDYFCVFFPYKFSHFLIPYSKEMIPEGAPLVLNPSEDLSAVVPPSVDNEPGPSN